eukprot:5788067-Prymnesium_polylepis.2
MGCFSLCSEPVVLRPETLALRSRLTATRVGGGCDFTTRDQEAAVALTAAANANAGVTLVRRIEHLERTPHALQRQAYTSMRFITAASATAVLNLLRGSHAQAHSAWWGAAFLRYTGVQASTAHRQ